MSKQIQGRRIILGITIFFVMIFSSAILIYFGPVISFLFAFFSMICFVRGLLSIDVMQRGLSRMNIEGAYISRIGILGSPSSASMINRIIINPIDETQYTITGRSDMTFRESCLYDWPFQNIRIDSKWYIFSENETDISNLPLSRYDGIAWIRTE